MFGSVVRFVEERLKLKVNREKSAVDRPWRRKFLGLSLTQEKVARIRIAPKSTNRFKMRVKEITRRRRGTGMKERLYKLNEYLRGWFGYFKLIETPSILHDFDKWIRRRLRACLLSQWKNPATVRRNLVHLGLPEMWASLISRSRKGIWRLSKTPQIQKAPGLAYWRTQGLFSLTENYRLHCESL